MPRALIASDDIRAVAPGINATLADLRGLQPAITETLAEFRTITPELNSTLDEATATLEEIRLITAGLRESGATENVNNVFASAANAADAVEAAAGELPQLTARLTVLANRTEQVIASYGDQFAAGHRRALDAARRERGGRCAARPRPHHPAQPQFPYPRPMT